MREQESILSPLSAELRTGQNDETISGWFGKSRCRELQSDIPIKGPEGLAAAEDEVEVDPRRGDRFEVKWGRGL